MITDINQIVSKLDTIEVLPTTIYKPLSYVKLYISAYKLCGDNALPLLKQYYSELLDSLYKEYTACPFYSDTPLQRLLKEIFSPHYVYEEPWGYDAAY